MEKSVKTVTVFLAHSRAIYEMLYYAQPGNNKWPRASHGAVGVVFLLDKPQLLAYIIAIQEVGRVAEWQTLGT